ncbi:MAG: hypothetical protein NTW87_03785 [Planctomycetota bacterium]|nr:hypothetical protein [Planctomycetota bacterium]
MDFERRVTARLAAGQTMTDAPVVGAASKGSAPTAPAAKELPPNGPSVRVGTARARGAAAP